MNNTGMSVDKLGLRGINKMSILAGVKWQRDLPKDRKQRSSPLCSKSITS